MVLLGKGTSQLWSSLPQENTYILVFCGFCSENHLHRFQMNTVNFAQCRQKADNNRCRRGKTTNRQTSFDDAGQTNFRPVLLAQHLAAPRRWLTPNSPSFSSGTAFTKNCARSGNSTTAIPQHHCVSDGMPCGCPY